MRRSNVATGVAAAAPGSHPGLRCFGGELHARAAGPGVGRKSTDRMHCRRCRRSNGDGVPEQRSRAVDRRQPDEPGQHDRDLAAGPLAEQRSTRAGGMGHDERRRQLEPGRKPQDDGLHGRNGRESGQLPARDRPVGHFRARRSRPPAEPLLQRPRASVHDVRLRPCAAREQVARWRRDLERSGRRDQRHGTDGVQRQADHHRGSDESNFVYAAWDRLVFPASERASVVAAFNTS